MTTDEDPYATADGTPRVHQMLSTWSIVRIEAQHERNDTMVLAIFGLPRPKAGEVRGSSVELLLNESRHLEVHWDGLPTLELIGSSMQSMDLFESVQSQNRWLQVMRLPLLAGIRKVGQWIPITQTTRDPRSRMTR